MREILFRGKRTDTGEWVYGDLLNVGADYDYAIRTYGGRGHGQVNAVNEKTIGQFTGLTDKNGKKIFEGDIATGLFLFGMEIRAVVAFQDGAFGLQWNRGGVKEFSAFTSICNVQYEIVGNIHDNPELMEG